MTATAAKPREAIPPGAVRQFWDLEGPDMELRADAVVVGSGAGGATVACELQEGGLSVVVLEEGGAYDTRSFRTDPAFGIQHLYRAAGAEMVQGSPPIIIAQGRCLGGSTVINGGMSWRTPAPVLRRWRVELGLPGVSPAELDPIFQRLEKRLHVGPQSPESLGRDALVLKRGADALGYRVVEDPRNQRHCVGSNNCAFGCPTGAKQSMLVSYLPRAAALGARILTDVRVDRVLTDHRKRRATGAEGRAVCPKTGRRGPRVTVHAPRVVLACGATETPALLLRNRLANRSGQVGRNLTLHPNAKCVGEFKEPIHAWRGVHQAHQIHELLSEGLLSTIAFVPPEILALSMPYLGDELFEVIGRIDRLVVAGALVEDTVTGRVRPGPFGQPAVRYQLTPFDLERLLRGVALTAEILFAGGAHRVFLPIQGREPLRGPDDIASIFRGRVRPRDLEVLTVHIMGTCRAGVDPRQSVVDPFGASHDVEGLYVADASVLPTPIGLNPMLTIMALATRTALRILKMV